MKLPSFFLGIAFYLSCALVGTQAQARIAQKTDLSIWPEFDHVSINIFKDGTYDFVQEYQFQVLNDGGREEESVQTLPFDAQSSELKLISAKVITTENGVSKSEEVATRNIELRELGDTPQVFDSQKQLVISFPNVHIGSHIFVKYKVHFKEAPIAGKWSWATRYDNIDIEDVSVHIRSELPLHFWKKDPEQTFEFKESHDGSSMVLDLHNLKPLQQMISQEENSYFAPEHAIVAAVSTDTEWKTFAESISADYLKLENEKLPPGLEKIRKDVGNLPKSVLTNEQVLEKLNKVHAAIAERYRYFGDWRRRNGGQIPRHLQEIDDTSYGDCKDLALAAVAIFRSLGLDANVAWIWRGDEPVADDLYHFPIESSFNHAIARVEYAGKVYWVDATNPVTFSHGIPLDISDRPAYVMRHEPFLDHTPPLKPDENFFRSDFRYKLLKDKSVDVQGQIEFRGRAATNLIVRNFYDSPETVDYELIRSITGADRVLSFKVEDFDRKSRFVRDLSIGVKYQLADIGLKTSAGYGLNLGRHDVIDRLLVDPKERESDLYLSPPSLTEQKVFISGVQKIGKLSLACDINSQWTHLTRKINESRSGVVVDDIYEIHKDHILREEMTTSEFAKFQAKVRDCFYNSSLILK